MSKSVRSLLGIITSLALAATVSCSSPFVPSAGQASDSKAVSQSWIASSTVPGIKDHGKQVIGYITQWDAWKATNAGLPSAGALTHLNVDMSQYSILNFSFFGVAQDGSLHSGDFRNKNIYQTGVNQAPQPIFYTDAYSSWDLFILFGELDLVQYISADIAKRATAQGFVVQEGGTTWTHPTWGLSGSLPLPLHKEDGAPGLLELAHANGTKVMASIGGWSMCKHFPEMAADPAKRAKFIADCKRLIDIGFDGIDLDWEYPGPYSGMNFTGTNADFANFLTLVREIRAAIGPDKLITAAMSADTEKLEGLNWTELDKVMNYFNFMTYDFNGGWSNIAGHNSPLHAYPGAEAPFNWDSLLVWLKAKNVDLGKVSFGSAFYGRGVVTNGPAALNAPTVKRAETVQPDGPISTCADYTNWPKDVFDGTPNYEFIRQVALKSGSGWTRKWDADAGVPYLVKDNFFLSYDDAESIALKANFIKQNGLAGTIVWTVYGDLEFGGSVTNYGTKLKKWSDVKSPLVNTINRVFADTNGNILPSAAITAPANNSTVNLGASIVVSAQASDADGSVVKLELLVDGNRVQELTAAPWNFSLSGLTAGKHSLTVRATDDKNGIANSPAVSIEVTDPNNKVPTVSITSPANGYNPVAPASFTVTAEAADSDGSISKVEIVKDGSVVATLTAAPYTWNASALAAGTVVFTARATDNKGAVSVSAPVSVTVKPPVITCNLPVWNKDTVYGSGVYEVHWNGADWRAGWWTQGQEPGTTGEWGVWKKIKDCGDVVQPVYFTVTATAGANGSISPAGAQQVEQGKSISFTVSAAAGYKIADVTVDGASKGAVASVTVGNVQKNLVVAASFVKSDDPVVEYTITASAGANGSISPAGATKVVKGGSQRYTFAPASGYAVDKVIVAGIEVALAADGSYTVANVQANTGISVSFKIGGDPAIPAWNANNVAYKLNDKVTYQGATYVCKYAHSSNSAWVPGTPGLWLWEKI